MLAYFLFAMTAVSLLEIGMAVPLMCRQVRPNGYFGLRTSDTTADEWVWYEANAATGRDLLALALAQLGGLYLPWAFPPVNPGLYFVGNLSLVVCGALTISVAGAVRAHFMRKRRIREGGE